MSEHDVPRHPAQAGPGPPPPGAGEHAVPGSLPPGGYPTVIYVQPRTNGYAVAALVLGIVWVYGVTSNLQTGRGMAVAGIVLGWWGSHC